MTRATRNPTVLRHILANQLRQMRNDAGLTLDDVEERLSIPKSVMSRAEGKKTGFRERDVRALLELYGVQDAELAAAMDIAKAARKSGWQRKYSSALPEWFKTYVGLESDADLHWEYEIQLVPGLLQTEAYARAVLEAGTVVSTKPVDIDRQVELRMQRKRVLEREKPSEYWVVLSEAALYKEIGGPQVMAEQLRHIVTVSKSSGVTIQVLPFSHGAHPAMTSSFSVLGFDEVPGNVVYLDYPTGSIFLDEAEELQRQEVQQYLASFRQLTATAMPAAQSVTLIAQVAERMAETDGR